MNNTGLWVSGRNPSSNSLLALLGETLISPRDTGRSADGGKPANTGSLLISELFNSKSSLQVSSLMK